MYTIPTSVEYEDEVKKMVCVITDPTLPPAPVKPEITPRDLREMNGMIPNVAPQAACTKKEKMIITPMEALRVLVLPRMMQKTPPSDWMIQRFHRRPRMPNLLPSRSEMTPPLGREKKFMNPNREAIKPALERFIPNLS